MKKCSTCQTELPLESFYKNRRQKDGLGNNCRDCMKDHARRNKYGLTPTEYEAMKAKCQNRCEICGASPGHRELDIDHCHTTGEVRGLLCPLCNKAIGLLGDDPSLLEAAIAYLRR